MRQAISNLSPEVLLRVLWNLRGVDSFTVSTVAGKTFILSRLHSTVHCDRTKYSGVRL